MPAPDILEAVSKTQIQKHPLLREDMAYYNRRPLDDKERSYYTLHEYVKNMRHVTPTAAS